MIRTRIDTTSRTGKEKTKDTRLYKNVIFMLMSKKLISVAAICKKKKCFNKRKQQKQEKFFFILEAERYSSSHSAVHATHRFHKQDSKFLVFTEYD